MIKKTLAVAALAAGAVVSIAPQAFADNADPNAYSDQTANFVVYNDPAVLGAKDAGKQIIVSPYGTSHTIACKGNGVDVPLYACMQQDNPGLGWIILQQQDLPGLGPAWVDTMQNDPNA
ncbi:hypothetical protein VMT65_00535 [Nocardia sp. CDC153]|uniref:hypothetical protein n=1 Tax=Nocardia sp. CDC153 TaxID=3112167 RepID=UPI002DBBDA36|nr:hypothetical protein [Nocardia sp. CDC153]MEC3951508.1 hypothetical protein [Nocardia sp. CDC153]